MNLFVCALIVPFLTVAVAVDGVLAWFNWRWHWLDRCIDWLTDELWEEWRK